MTERDPLPLQHEMFSSKLVDNRSDKQRKADLERTHTTLLMFSQREMLPRVGMKAHPKLPLPEKVTLPALWSDHRTDEEIERDTQRQAEALTQPMFADEEGIHRGQDMNTDEPTKPIEPIQVTPNPDETIQRESVPPSEKPKAKRKRPAKPSPTRTKGELAIQLPSKETVYLALVAAYKDFTQPQADGSSLPEALRLGAALDLADQVGLSTAEGRAAAAIGTFRGQQQIGKRRETTAIAGPFPDPPVDRGSALASVSEESSAREVEVVHLSSSEEPLPLDEIPDVPPEALEDFKAARLAIYLRLIQLAQEQDTGGERYPTGFLAHFALTVADALNYGLGREEIHAAVQIGQIRKRQTSIAPETSKLLDSLQVNGEETPLSQPLLLDVPTLTSAKLHAYLSLIQTVETHTRLGVSPTGLSHAQSEPFAQAQAAKAAAAGLNTGEIQAALAIARQRAGVRRETRDVSVTAPEPAKESA
jgi:hypothetical protein